MGLKLTSFLHKGKGKAKKHDKSSKLGASDLKSKDKSHKKSKDKAKGSHEQNHVTQSPKQSSGKKSKDKGKNLGAPERNLTPQSPQSTLKVGSSSQTLGNSQESFVDGLSPELSDCGDHSSEVDTTPREARILRAGYDIGLSISVDNKNNCIVVKSVSSNGAVGRDGRIRGGDRVEAINGKMLTGLSLNHAKGILKRAAKSDEICIAYSPSPSPAQFSLSSLPASQDKSRKSTPQENKPAPHSQNELYSIASMAAPLHNQDSSIPPGSSGGGEYSDALHDPPSAGTVPSRDAADRAAVADGWGDGPLSPWGRHPPNAAASGLLRPEAQGGADGETPTPIPLPSSGPTPWSREDNCRADPLHGGG